MCLVDISICNLLAYNSNVFKIHSTRLFLAPFTLEQFSTARPEEKHGSVKKYHRANMFTLYFYPCYFLFLDLT